jgi:hypothetical protein
MQEGMIRADYSFIFRKPSKANLLPASALGHNGSFHPPKQVHSLVIIHC